MAKKHCGPYVDLNETKKFKENATSLKDIKIENDMFENDLYKVKIKEEIADSMICNETFETFLPDSEIKIETVKNYSEKKWINGLVKELNDEYGNSKDLENISVHSSENVLVKEEKSSELIEEEHLRKVAEQTSYESLGCGESSNRQNHLSYQEKSVHADKKTFRCDECGTTFWRKNDLSCHLRIHSGEKPFKCDICRKLFGTKAHLKIHILTHTDKRPFKCNICSKTFKRKQHVVQHKLYHHSEIKQHICEHCDKHFARMHDLIRHKRVHSDISHIHSCDKSFKCDICEKAIFKEPYHICDICNKTFSRKTNLMRHKLIHSGHKQHSCDQCDKQFLLKHHLIIHKRVHSGEKPHKCDVCGKAFLNHSGLIVHRRIHTGEKPFSCDICKKCFSSKLNLNYHKQKFHKN